MTCELNVVYIYSERVTLFLPEMFMFWYYLWRCAESAKAKLNVK